MILNQKHEESQSFKLCELGSEIVINTVRANQFEDCSIFIRFLLINRYPESFENGLNFRELFASFPKGSNGPIQYDLLITNMENKEFRYTLTSKSKWSDGKFIPDSY